ncbi:Thioredoxin reductase [Buchnera aphidicola (Eriosoma lanigerum)]|uniref:thioredoxin-disulfide reductase n=1 Tax=Buchnera aphidicola TaxID=9 RepID=UPI0034642D60
MKKKIKSKLIIVGSGPAGYTASIYAARANLSPILITGLNPGGQLVTTNEIENWPGEINTISGIELMNRMHKQSLHLNTRIISDFVQEVDFSHSPFKLFGEEYKYTADCIIVATGSNPRYLGLESEKKFLGKGVSTCATCDGFFYKGKEVAVVGGGNTAVEETLYLSNIASKVHLIHRKAILKAEKILVQRLQKKIQNNQVIFYKNTNVTNITGNSNSVNKIHIKFNNTINEIPVSGIFIAIGHNPNTDIFKNQLIINNGYIQVAGRGMHKNSTKTSKLGIFAAGDVIDHCYRQAITAAATGCMAALDAEKYLDNMIN